MHARAHTRTHTHTASHLHTLLSQASTLSLTWTTVIGSLASDLASNSSPSVTRKICPNEFSLYTLPEACQHDLSPYRTNLHLSKDGVAQSRTRLKWLSSSSSKVAYRLFLIWFMPTPSAALSPVILRTLDYKDIESLVELVCTPCYIPHAVGKVMSVLFNNRLYPNTKYKKKDR